MRFQTTTALIALIVVSIAAGTTYQHVPANRQEAVDKPQDKKRSADPANKDEKRQPAPKQHTPPSPGAKPLNKQKTVWLDYTGKRVFLKTKVCNRNAPLEMFCCLIERKLHESILVLNADAYQVHAALQLLKAKPGKPARYVEQKNGYKFIPATGDRIDIFVSWKDKSGKTHRKPAQEWVRHTIHRYFIANLAKLPESIKMPRKDELRYDTQRKELLWFGPMTKEQKAQLLSLSDDKQYRAGIEYFHKAGQKRQLKCDFVFAGSAFFKDESGKQHYAAEGGWLICVANMPQAMIDVTVESSSSDGSISYEAWTERIPELGTEVTIELIPRPSKKTATTKTKSGAKVPTQPKSDGGKQRGGGR